ncbi:site-specific integrase [Spiribacter curvatus]|uniref:site-specific integrase n=1 Tax=Spiribacter curvatus TaxID=1335757 RepID=UPI0004243F0F|nr:site-specific integrase [Spiribacter curvatus]
MTSGSKKDQKHRSVPIKESISKIGRGYPDKLVIFRIPASSFWWVRYYTQGRVLKKSTKTQDKRDAIEFAKRFYEDVLLRERNLLPLRHNRSFEKCALTLLEEQEELIARGERNPKLNKNDRLKLDKDILPFFAEFNVRDITYKHIKDYVRTLSSRDLRPTTIKVHLTLINKILTVGLREGLVDRLPPMPKIKVVDSPRGWFSKEEYDLLKKTALSLAKDGVVVRYHPITREMYLLTLFMVNTFLRPSDIKSLKYRNVQIVNDEYTYLRIQTDNSKTVNTAVVSMEAGVGVMSEIHDLQRSLDRPTGPEDYLFFPQLLNRDYALQTMRRQFEKILSEANLKRSATGESRTLYSLRHTAIMFRLTMGDHIDLLSLARNARTSVDMIERFYARPLQGEMNIDKIQSMRKSVSRKSSATARRG